MGGTRTNVAKETNGNLADIKTSVQLLDNAISGSEMQVDVVASLPAGTNNIGDVDVLSLPALPTGTNSIGQVTANAGTNLNTSALALETTQSAGNVLIGAVTETAPASDTASSGLNGRLQRIAQRITSLITALGSPFQAGGSIGNTAFGVNNASGASAVNIQDGGNSITVDGTITANAGTNLNTSALALEATQSANFSLLAAIDAATASTNDNTGYTVARLDSILARTTIDQDLRNDSTDMTVTGLASLASSATVGWQSDRVEINTELDVLVSIKLDMANTAPANDKSCYIYLCSWYYDSVTWYGSSLGTATLPTGTNGACTIASAAPNNLKLLGTLAYSTADMVLQDSYLLSNVFGTTMPDAWSIVVINYSGASTHSSGHKLMYKKINQQTV
jgi:hypothetical protein